MATLNLLMRSSDFFKSFFGYGSDGIGGHKYKQGYWRYLHSHLPLPESSIRKTAVEQVGILQSLFIIIIYIYFNSLSYYFIIFRIKCCHYIIAFHRDFIEISYSLHNYNVGENVDIKKRYEHFSPNKLICLNKYYCD
jgi:hypothetical protein